MRHVVGVYPLLPNRMSVDRDEYGELVYTYTPMSDANPKFKSDQSIKLRREDALHIPGLGFDGLVGYSPIAMARNAVGMPFACEEVWLCFLCQRRTSQWCPQASGSVKEALINSATPS